MKWSRKWIVVNELDIHEFELKTHVYWTIGHDFRSLVVLLSERSLNWVVIYCWRVNFIDMDHQFSHKFDTNQSWKGCFPLSGCRIYLNCVENKFSKIMVFYSNENCYLADVFFVIVVLLCVSVFWETVFFCFKANALLSRQKNVCFEVSSVSISMELDETDHWETYMCIHRDTKIFNRKFSRYRSIIEKFTGLQNFKPQTANLLRKCNFLAQKC